MKKLLIALLLALPTLSFADKNETAAAATTTEAAAATTDLEGTIADISDYAPLSNVKVVVTCDEHKINKTVLTDKEGRFALDELPEGNYKVRFERDGYEPLTRNSLIVKNDKKNYFGFFLFKD
jgi:hypothetical protein